MRTYIALGILFCFSVAAHSYDVVLKNGKMVQGTKVGEDENMLVIQDAAGVRINIKKSNVDPEKTQAANQQAAVQPPTPPPSTPTTPATQKPATKKPARKLNQEDLEKLREKYDLGEGTFSKDSPEGSEDQTEEETDSYSEKSESEWQAESEKHRERIKQAEERSARLSEECEKLKQIAVQTHVLTDQQGNELPITETTQKVCELAESAKSKLEEERSSYSEFVSEAKENAVPPGWLRDKEGNDPNEE